MPFPSRFFGIDLADVGPRTRMTDLCGEWSYDKYGYVELNAATVGNVLVGILSLPFIVAYASLKLRPNPPLQPAAEKRGG
jgi:hypothetical protein